MSTTFPSCLLLEYEGTKSPHPVSIFAQNHLFMTFIKKRKALITVIDVVNFNSISIP